MDVGRDIEITSLHVPRRRLKQIVCRNDDAIQHNSIKALACDLVIYELADCVQTGKRNCLAHTPGGFNYDAICPSLLIADTDRETGRVRPLDCSGSHRDD